MAEGILFNSVENILLLLGSGAVQQIGLAWGVKKELRKLQDTMIVLKNVLQDAEKKEVNHGAVKEWLQRLKVVVRDADDLLDEFAAEDLRRQVQTQGSKIKEVHNFFTSFNPLKFRYVAVRKIKDIVEELDQIVSDMRQFNFIVGVVDRPVEIRKREETHSFVPSSNVIGRDGDKEAIIQWLESSTSEQNVQILPILAMGGMGKTTLAQLVYNDDRVASQFHRLWICVSDNFDVKTVLSNIVGEATSLAIEVLQRRLRELLRERKYFLVLDDVWTEDPVEWRKLEVMLRAGAGGSRIVVTTRSPKVAEVVGTMAPYKLKGLSEMECLSILVKWAFKEGEDSKHQNLVNIGRQIVRKCGVPLAARSLGALLFSVTDEREWCSLRDNEMWRRVQNENDILPVLKWSYDKMPSCLKQCFGYCSLFQKDAVLDKEELVYQWIALGFIQSSSHQNKELEDIGESYFEELLRMSFVQHGDKYGYKMHDLVHDLAQSVAFGSECFVIKHNNTEMIPASVSHISFDEFSSSELPRPLLEVRNKWRTILWASKREPSFDSSFEKLVSSSKYLRVLHMPYVSPFDGKAKNIALPSSIGKLKHLRFLRCRDLKELPKSFGKLLNLQYLYLYQSSIRELPEDFGNLINLRLLWLLGCEQLMTCLPEKGIGGLTSLRILRLHYNYQLVSLGEGIRHLTCLRELIIEGCQKLGSLPSGMRDLADLEKLEISKCHALTFSEDDFQGLRKLKSLELCGLPGVVSLPKGLQDAAASLNHLTISRCDNLTTLAECLPSLTSLQQLQIAFCPKLSSLPEGMQHLIALRHLEIEYCPMLTERFEGSREEEWCKIAHVPKIEIDGQLRN